MSAPSPFEANGTMSAQAACEQIIQRIPAKDGITVDQAIDDVAELTGYRHPRETVTASMYRASRALIKRHVLGVRAVTNGWVRMDDTAAIEDSRERERRARRQVERSGDAAVTADPEKLTWEDRQHRDHAIRVREQAAALLGRRARRLRPVDPDELKQA